MDPLKYIIIIIKMANYHKTLFLTLGPVCVYGYSCTVKDQHTHLEHVSFNESPEYYKDLLIKHYGEDFEEHLSKNLHAWTYMFTIAKNK